jgi:hypothetical protein
MVFGGSWIAKPSATATSPIALPAGSTHRSDRGAALQQETESPSNKPIRSFQPCERLKVAAARQTPRAPRRMLSRGGHSGSMVAVVPVGGFNCARPCDGSVTTVAGFKSSAAGRDGGGSTRRPPASYHDGAKLPNDRVASEATASLRGILVTTCPSDGSSRPCAAAPSGGDRRQGRPFHGSDYASRAAERAVG